MNVILWLTSCSAICGLGGSATPGTLRVTTGGTNVNMGSLNTSIALPMTMTSGKMNARRSATASESGAKVAGSHARSAIIGPGKNEFPFVRRLHAATLVKAGSACSIPAPVFGIWTALSPATALAKSVHGGLRSGNGPGPGRGPAEAGADAAMQSSEVTVIAGTRRLCTGTSSALIAWSGRGIGIHTPWTSISRSLEDSTPVHPRRAAFYAEKPRRNWASAERLLADPHHHSPRRSGPAGGERVAAGQVPERAVGRHAHVDRARNARLAKHLHRRRAAGREPAELVRAVLLEEVAVAPVLAEARDCPYLERPAGEAAAMVMAVGVERVHERRLVRRTLRGRPAVVAAADQLVHLLEPRPPHVVHEDAASLRMDVERERVAETSREDRGVAAARLVAERVVGGDAAVFSQPQDLARCRSEAVRQRAVAALARAGVEHAVAPEAQRAADVLVRAMRVELVDDPFAAGDRRVAGRGEARDDVVPRRGVRRVGDVHVVRARERRIERHAEQPFFFD